MISANIAAQTITFRELAAATNNFQPERLLGEGRFGRVYKGYLENNRRVINYFLIPNRSYSPQLFVNMLPMRYLEKKNFILHFSKF